jgi:hypothetical protein
VKELVAVTPDPASVAAGVALLAWVVVVPLLWVVAGAGSRLLVHRRAPKNPGTGRRFGPRRWDSPIGAALALAWAAGVLLVPMATAWVVERAERSDLRRDCRQSLVASEQRITAEALDDCVNDRLLD